MPKKDPRVDAYISKSAPFAKPILVHLRKTIHATCPDVEETLKWGMPNFMYHGILCNMAAFKEHCTFGFWHKAMRKDLLDRDASQGMGQFGRMTAKADLPNDATLKKLIKMAMQLNANGVKVPSKPKAKKPPPVAPADLASALKRNALARATWEKFPPSHRREYIEWLTEAKREETREKRLLTTLEWLADGKSRNWKYENC